MMKVSLKKICFFVLAMFLALSLTAHATISIETSRVQYTCNGTTVAYTYPFEIIEDSDIIAVKTDSTGAETTLVLNTDYAVSGAGSSTGGTLTLTAGSKCASGYTLTILRDIPLTQETDYVDGDAFSAESFESALDKEMLINQQQAEQLNRTLHVGKSSNLTGLDVPVSAGRAIGWNSAGTGITVYSPTNLTTIDFDNLSNYGGSLNTALTSIGATEQTLVCNTATTLTANAVIPATLHFMPLKGCMITKASTYTITFHSQPTAEYFQWLSGFTGADIIGLTYAYPEWVGAKGDGVTNDAAALQAIATSLANTDGEFRTVANKTYLATSQVDLRDVNCIDSKGTLLTSYTIGPAFLIGHDADVASTCRKSFHKLVDATPTTVPTYPIVRLSGLSNANVYIGSSNYVQLYAVNDGVTTAERAVKYSDFTFGYTPKLELTNDGPGTGTSFINENRFHGGKIKTLVIGGTYHHNNNIFYSPDIEGVDCSITFNVGNSNIIENGRFECSSSGSAPNEASITFAAGTQNNTIVASYMSDFTTPGVDPLPSTMHVYDYGTANVYYRKQMLGYTQRKLLDISKWTPMYSNGTDTTFNQKGMVDTDNCIVPGLDYLTFKTNYRKIWESDILPAHEGDMYKFVSDVESTFSTTNKLRLYVYVYDANKVPLVGAIDKGVSYDPCGVGHGGTGIAELNMSGKAWNADGYYELTANVESPGFSLQNLNLIKYIKIALRTGNSVTSDKFRYIQGYYWTRHKQDYEMDAMVAPHKKGFALGSVPTKGYGPVGDVVSKTDGSEYYVNTFQFETTSINIIGVGDVSTYVVSATGVADKDIVGIEQGDGTTHWTTVSGTPSGSNIIFAAGPTVATVAGARIVFNRWATYPSTSYSIPVPGTAGNVMTSNGTAWTSAASSVPVKATGAELDTGTDDAKFATAKALKDSHNVPSVAPGTSGNVLTSNGTDWTSATPAATGIWTQTTGTFTATPASTSTITMTTDLTATILVGMGLKYVIGGTTYYGRVAAIASNLLTVNGAPLGGDVTALYYGGTITQVVVSVNGLYEDATDSTLLASDNRMQFVWHKPKSYLVYFSAYSIVHDSGGTHGNVNVMVNSAAVSTTDTNKGPLIAANTTWYPTTIDINTSNYDINPGEVLEIQATKGTTGDAEDLTVLMIFVTP